MDRRTITTVEMHTGGEPVRIVTGGYPEIEGQTILAKRRYAGEHLDHLRRRLMFEPRGHADMYGVIPVQPDLADADLAVLFTHSEGYSTMCGHAVIALGRYAVDHGLVPVTEPLTTVRIQCPCGMVVATVEVGDGKSGRVSFRSVPSFASRLDLPIEVAGADPVAVDVGYGGAFYAVVPAARFGLDVLESPVRSLVETATAVTDAVNGVYRVVHPDDPDLGFLYGTILTDGRSGAAEPSANVCVFAGTQVDRSPTGSGVSARLALAHARGEAVPGDEHRFASITGAIFTGRIAEADDTGSVVVQVTGRAHYTGTSTFTIEEDDPLGDGFLLA